MRKQRGLSMVNVLAWGIILGGGLVLGLKMVPAYNEYFGVKKAIADLAKQMAGAPPSDIRDAFNKRATIEYITTITGEDLEIVQDQSGTSISTSYEKVIPLVSNVSLKFDFQTEAKHGGGGAVSGDTSRLEAALGHPFRDPGLLRQALTHRSYGQPHNERLEFLGDSILNAAVARLLFDTFPALSEGELSRLRASLVKKETLAELALALNLSAHLRLGEGEVRSGGYQRPSILADTLEALFAAICLDSDYAEASSAVVRLVGPRIAAIDPHTHGKDSKTRLQEWLQARRHALPQYTIVNQQGEAHDQQFVVECRISELSLTTRGEGTSRRAAEQAAATLALHSLPEGRSSKS